MINIFSKRVLQGFAYLTAIFPDFDSYQALSLTDEEKELVKNWQKFQFIVSIVLTVIVCILLPFGFSFLISIIFLIIICLAVLPTVLRVYFKNIKQE